MSDQDARANAAYTISQLDARANAAYSAQEEPFTAQHAVRTDQLQPPPAHASAPAYTAQLEARTDQLLQPPAHASPAAYTVHDAARTHLEARRDQLQPPSATAYTAQAARTQLDAHGHPLLLQPPPVQASSAAYTELQEARAHLAAVYKAQEAAQSTGGAALQLRVSAAQEAFSLESAEARSAQQEPRQSPRQVCIFVRSVKTFVYDRYQCPRLLGHVPW